jgi:hypothetical protein
MPVAIVNSLDTNKGTIVTYGTGALGSGSGTATLAGNTVYNYTDYTVSSGNTLTVGHKATIKCTGTFTLASGGTIAIGIQTGTPAAAAANGYYGASNNGIAGGGGVGSTITGTPFTTGGGFFPALYVLQPVDYLTYSAAAPVSVLAAPVDFMGGGNGGSCGSSGGGQGYGAIKIMADKIVINGTISGAGGAGSAFNNIGSGGGGGGTCWLVSTIFSGSYTVNCGGGFGSGGGAGAGGRIRIDYALGSAPTVAANNAGGGGTSATITTYNSMMLLGGGAMDY